MGGPYKMYVILPFSRIDEAAQHIDSRAFEYIGALQSESFEEYDGFDLLAFDWYDISSDRTENSKIAVYMDKENVFFFCADDEALICVRTICDSVENSGGMSCEQLLYTFFVKLLKGNISFLEKMEEEMNDAEDEILSDVNGDTADTLGKISGWRRELLRLKRYYEQLDVIFDEMAANDNGLLSRAMLKRVVILGNRTDRYLRTVKDLQDIAGQLCDVYQSQLSIRQNDFMKIFTIVTSVFLPLTLITGWYGMNFVMIPEIKWRFGYPCVIAVCVATVVFLFRYFKRKKWL